MNQHARTASIEPKEPAASTAESRFVMERKGRLEDLDRSFDIEFWQRQGTTAIFSAAWGLVELYHRRWGQDSHALRLQRTVENFQRLPS
jgi:hypothetical protein